MEVVKRKNTTILHTPGVFSTAWNIQATKAGRVTLHNLKDVRHCVLPDRRKRNRREQQVEMSIDENNGCR